MIKIIALIIFAALTAIAFRGKDNDQDFGL